MLRNQCRSNASARQSNDAVKPARFDVSGSRPPPASQQASEAISATPLKRNNTPDGEKNFVRHRCSAMPESVHSRNGMATRLATPE